MIDPIRELTVALFSFFLLVYLLFIFYYCYHFFFSCLYLFINDTDLNGQVDYVETAESAEIFLSLPNQTFTYQYNVCPRC